MPEAIYRVFVGSYGAGPTRKEIPGAVHTLDFLDDGTLVERSAAGSGMEAGSLTLSADGTKVYALDERRNDGRGPVGRAASLFAYDIDPATGALTQISQHRTYAAYPTYVSADPKGEFVVTASHGSFEHVEHVIEVDGGFAIENLYDDSAVCLFPITSDGGTEAPSDVFVMNHHSLDPGPSPQVGGHSQASSHAHSALFDPSGQFVIVCDKGADEIYVLRLDREARRLRPWQVVYAPTTTGPRHPVFHPDGHIVFMTDELSSGVSAYGFDQATGTLTHLASAKATSPGFEGYNEPADITIHPSGRFVFLNNRGEDAIASFAVNAETGELTFVASAPVAKSPNPGFAARCVLVDPSGKWLLAADRPADRVIVFAVDPETGALDKVSEAHVPGAGFIRLHAISS